MSLGWKQWKWRNHFLKSILVRWEVLECHLQVWPLLAQGWLLELAKSQVPYQQMGNWTKRFWVNFWLWYQWSTWPKMGWEEEKWRVLNEMEGCFNSLCKDIGEWIDILKITSYLRSPCRREFSSSRNQDTHHLHTGWASYRTKKKETGKEGRGWNAAGHCVWLQ